MALAWSAPETTITISPSWLPGRGRPSRALQSTGDASTPVAGPRAPRSTIASTRARQSPSSRDCGCAPPRRRRRRPRDDDAGPRLEVGAQLVAARDDVLPVGELAIEEVAQEARDG